MNFIKLVVFILFTLSLIVQPSQTSAEPSPLGRSPLPIIVTLQFHSMSLPFQNLGSNFSNIGISIGTEYGFTDSQSWLQQIHIGYYRNKAIGNGIMLYTQTVFRPQTLMDNNVSLKAGAGYQYSFRPHESYRQINGEWKPVGKRGKGMLMLPAGVSLGYNSAFDKARISPFVSYQFILVSGYNKSIPLVPQTLIQAGSKIDI